MRILIHRSYHTKTGGLLILVFLFLFLFSCENKKPEYNKNLSDQINLLNIQRGYFNDPNFKSACLTYELFDEPCFEDLDTLNHLLRIKINRINYGTEIFIFKKYGIDAMVVGILPEERTSDAFYKMITSVLAIKKIFDQH